MEFEEEGFRFHPSDSELLTFLLRFIAEKDLHDKGFVMECDVYKQEPWVTYGYGRHCGGEDNGDTSIFRYFISPRHQKDESERFCRVVGEKLGTWKQQDKGKKVLSDQNKALIMGFKKSLTYNTNTSCPGDDKWLMKEYVFCEAILRKFRNSKFRNYVICAIKTKSKKASSNGSRCSNVSTTVMDFSDEQKMDTKVISGVNFVEPCMDQEYMAITPINIVETVLQIQEASSSEEKINELLENNGCGDSGIRNNQVLIQEAPREENGQLELNIFSQIQQPIENVKTNRNIPEIYDTLAEYMGVNVLMNPYDFPLIHPFDFSKRAIVESNQHQVQITQEAAGEENGLLGQTVPPFSQIQEFVMPKNNVPEMFDTGDTLLEINQTPQEESETLCETEESSFVADLTEALLDHVPLKDRLAIIRASKSTLLLDQQSWQSNAHLQDMLLAPGEFQLICGHNELARRSF